MSLTIGIDKGHTLSGNGTGSQGCGKREEVLTRELGDKVIKLLKDEGCKIVDCTVDKSSNQLYDRVKKANAQTLDLFVSIHFNSFNGTAKGTETYIYSNTSKAKPYAQRINDNIIKTLGTTNRGVKVGSSYYVIKNTNAPAMIVEVCFIDNKTDMDKYLNNIDKVAKAIAEGILNKSIATSVKPVIEPSTALYAVCVGAYNKENADKMCDELIKKGYKDTYLIKR